jgi:hypothetical protein
MSRALAVIGVDLLEPIVFQGLRDVWASGTRSACPWCHRPLPRIGDEICERSRCRKAAKEISPR